MQKWQGLNPKCAFRYDHLPSMIHTSELCVRSVLIHSPQAFGAPFECCCEQWPAINLPAPLNASRREFSLFAQPLPTFEVTRYADCAGGVNCDVFVAAWTWELMADAQIIVRLAISTVLMKKHAAAAQPPSISSLWPPTPEPCVPANLIRQFSQPACKVSDGCS